jgi:hypothetical protein
MAALNGSARFAAPWKLRPMPDPSGPAAAILAGIRERSEVAAKISVSWKAQIQRARASASDVPLLLAAVEAVLKLADEAIPALGLTPADCTDACDSGACDCSGTARVVAWNLDPAKVREAITAALREGGGDE